MKNKTNTNDIELIVQKISEARIKEELAIPIYSSHIKQTLFWSGLPKAKQEKIIAGLRILESDSEKHVGMLKIIEKNYLRNSK